MGSPISKPKHQFQLATLRAKAEAGSQMSQQQTTTHNCHAGHHHGASCHHDQPKKPISRPEKGVTYTCPMHPEIKQEGPGSCPICGMALEPLEVAPEAG